MDFSGTNSANMKPIFSGYPFQGKFQSIRNWDLIRWGNFLQFDSLSSMEMVILCFIHGVCCVARQLDSISTVIMRSLLILGVNTLSFMLFNFELVFIQWWIFDSHIMRAMTFIITRLAFSTHTHARTTHTQAQHSKIHALLFSMFFFLMNRIETICLFIILINWIFM